MQLDTGALSIAQEDIEMCCKDHKNIIGHIHISEPSLDPIGTHEIPHSYYGSIIKRFLPDTLLQLKYLQCTNKSLSMQ